MKRRTEILVTLVSALAGFGFLAGSHSKAGARVLEIPLKIGAASDTELPVGAAQAIVVLTGPADRSRSLARAARAAELHGHTGLPVMVCGSGAHTMEHVLEKNYAVRAKWLDEKSEDTFENAQLCAPILGNSMVKNVLLVTDEYHMWRARTVFGWAGIGVIPAPSSQLSQEPLSTLDILPSPEGRDRTKNALHELAGTTWYWARHLNCELTARKQRSDFS
jgi:uncharacterized SAM-binding protein YcdF (DUF218 family)